MSITVITVLMCIILCVLLLSLLVLAKGPPPLAAMDLSRAAREHSLEGAKRVPRNGGCK